MNRSLIAVALLAATAGGCSWLPDHTLDYQEAETRARMDVPGQVWFEGTDDLYPVPGADRRLQTENAHKGRFQPPPPPRIVQLTEAELDEEAVPPPPAQSRSLLIRDGNGYPIIMLNSAFVWAWQTVDEALAKTTLRVEDRDRSAGIFYVRVPSALELPVKQVQFKLSQTVNGTQVAVLNQEGSSLISQDVGQTLLQVLQDQL